MLIALAGLLAAAQAAPAPVPAPAPATTAAEDIAAVVAAVDRYLGAFVNHKQDEFRAMLHEKGGSFWVDYPPNRKPRISYRTNEEDVADIAKQKGDYKENYWSPTVLVHRDIAVFWAPYAFHHEGKRSHCGMNAFNLIRTDGQWKVANSMWTSEPRGCPQE